MGRSADTVSLDDIFKSSEAVTFNNIFESSEEITLTSFKDIEEKTPEYLVADYIPKSAITVIAGEGGIGKTSLYCAIAAAISSGQTPFLIQSNNTHRRCNKSEPQSVVIFSGEDSPEHVLKKRLRMNGACVENIYTIAQGDKNFKNIKFDSDFLKQLIAKYKPTLCIFDPVQSFIPTFLKMSERNAMRQCLQPLIGLAENYGTTFIIVIHANKMSGASGRKRMADSSDFWDIARSVLMVGETKDKGIRYLSHEKSSYGLQGQTVLFSIGDGGSIQFEGYSELKDRDFITELEQARRYAPAKEDTKSMILSFLNDGEKSVSELDEYLSAHSASKSTARRAKEELKDAGIVKYRSEGYGKEKRYYIATVQKDK